MVLRTGALYGRDPRSLKAAAELLALRGIHPSVEAAQAAVEHVHATPLPDKPERRRPVHYWLRSVRMVLVFGGFLSPPSQRDLNRPRPFGKLIDAAALILGAAAWVVTWIFPLTFMVLMAWSCERDTRRLGRKALAFYGGEAATMQAAITAADSGSDEGHERRQIVRTIAFVLSIALPIAFIAYATHIRNTKGINAFSAAGAIAALSLVIAVTVQTNRR